MEEQNNNLPGPLPTPEEVAVEQEGFEFLKHEQWSDVDVEEYKLDFESEYKPPKYTLSWNGIPFAPLGGIHAITGQSGHGKTMTIAQFMAAILAGQYGGLKYELPQKPVIVYIDTEMEEANTIAVKNRVMTMCGRDVRMKCDDFIIYKLREVQAKEEKDKKTGKTYIIPASAMRWKMILKAIYDNCKNLTAVFIDGLLDIVADFNDNRICQEIIYECMQTATHYNISLWCVVHQNPGGEKLVGHLGSFLERKVTDVIATAKDKSAPDGPVFKVTQKKARGRDFPDWKFHVEPITPWGVPEQIRPAGTKVNEKYNVEQVKQWLTQYQNEVEWPATQTEIKQKILKEKACIKDNNDLQDCITMAYNRKFIVEQSKDEYTQGQKHPKYYLNRNEIPEEPF